MTTTSTSTTPVETIGARTIPEFDGVHDVWPRGDRLAAVREAARAYKVRFNFHLNARSALHLIELRSGPQGHPAYREVAQEMHRLIAERAGHHAIAELMTFVDHSTEPELERIEAERRAEARRQGGAS